MVPEPDPAAPLRFPDVPKLELDQLMDQLVSRASDVKRTQGRLRGLLRAIELVTGDLELDAVLGNIVEAARELSGAKYAGLGVVSPAGGLEKFLHVGIPDEVVARIGRLPEGKGLIGALMTDPRPLRFEGATTDPRSVGFPPGHPPMGSFLGVSIHVRDEMFGNLYLGEALSGSFTEDDEALITALAQAAGSAISNARLYQEARDRQIWQQASVDVSAQVLTNADSPPLQLVADGLLAAVEADLVCANVLSRDGAVIIVQAAAGLGAADLEGQRFDLAGSPYGPAISSGDAVRLADCGEFGEDVPDMPGIAQGPMLAVPLTVGDAVRGTISLIRRRDSRPFTDLDCTLALAFAKHVSVVLELAESRAVEAKLMLLADRDRIAMDLHDHVIQELFAIGLGLESTAVGLGREHPVSQRLVQRVDDLDRVIKRIRTSIFALRGAVLSSGDDLRQRILDLATELTPALGFTPGVTFAGALDRPFDGEFVDDVTACVRESLTNVAKHADATRVDLDVAVAGGLLSIRVTDNGRGVGDSVRSSGTANLRARADKRGGTFTVAPGRPVGTTVIWTARIG